jgi:tetratricopeptide (TPR) repeat protein
VLIAVELLVPCNSQVLLAAELLLTQAPTPVAAAKEPALVLTPSKVTVNRTARQVDSPPARPVFSDPPTDQEIFRARVFAEPLVPMGATRPEENRALAQALLTFLSRTSNDEVAALTQFLAQYPNSAWRASLLTDLAIVYQKTGYFSRALSAWEQAWRLAKDQTEPNSRAIADRAVAEPLELGLALASRSQAVRMSFLKIWHPVSFAVRARRSVLADPSGEQSIGSSTTWRYSRCDEPSWNHLEKESPPTARN